LAAWVILYLIIPLFMVKVVVLCFKNILLNYLKKIMKNTIKKIAGGALVGRIVYLSKL